MARYCELDDEGCAEGVAQLFAHGRLITSRGTFTGRAELRAHIEENTIPNPGTRHVITNIEIDVHPDGVTATGRSYVTVFMAVSGFPLQPIRVGGYRDRFEKVDDTWRFAERHVVPFLVGDHSLDIRDPRPPSAGQATKGRQRRR